jgi:5'-nucleotidase
VVNVADKVSIVVSDFDRSGTSNHSTYGKYQSTLEATCQYHDEKHNISVFTTPGNPADCVMLGLGGLLGEETPDLVLSGINGGANIGPNWFGSGTIGAARTAAFFGVKSIAFSGFDDDNEKSFTIIPKWIAEFISSGILEDLDRTCYLTVGFPRIPFEEIKGVKIVERKVVFDNPVVFQLKKIWGEETNKVDSKTIWRPEIKGNPLSQKDKLDNYYLDKGYVIITPMSIDENNSALYKKLIQKENILPQLQFLKD